MPSYENVKYECGVNMAAGCPQDSNPNNKTCCKSCQKSPCADRCYDWMSCPAAIRVGPLVPEKGVQ